MVTWALFAVVGLFVGQSAESWQLTGRIVVGAEVWAVTGRASQSAGKLDRLEVSLANGANEERHLLVIRSGLAYRAEIDGVGSTVAAELPRLWLDSLAAGPERLKRGGGWICSAPPEVHCDSDGVTRIDLGFYGRGRLTYNRGRLVRMTFFSLAEWGNPFQGYVSADIEVR